MSYRCEPCGRPVPAGKPKNVHRVLRPDGSILRELAVCEACHIALAAGAELDFLVRFHAPKPPAPEQPQIADPIPPSIKRWAALTPKT